jgi:hypothetical protein
MPRRLVDVPSPNLHPRWESRSKRPSPWSRAVLGSAVAAGLLAVGVGPASADRVDSADAAGDMTGFTESSEGVAATPAPDHHAGDVTSVVVRHGRHAVTMKVSFAPLSRSHFNGFFGKVRTDPATRRFFVEDERDARPRLYVVNRRFRPVCGGATLHVDYREDTLAVRLPRTCLKRPDWVRATAMSANDKGDGSNTYYLDDAFNPSPVEDSEGRGTWSARVYGR